MTARISGITANIQQPRSFLWWLAFLLVLGAVGMGSVALIVAGLSAAWLGALAAGVGALWVVARGLGALVEVWWTARENQRDREHELRLLVTQAALAREMSRSRAGEGATWTQPAPAPQLPQQGRPALPKPIERLEPDLVLFDSEEAARAYAHRLRGGA